MMLSCGPNPHIEARAIAGACVHANTKVNVNVNVNCGIVLVRTSCILRRWPSLELMF